MPEYSDTVDREDDPTNVGEDGSPNCSPFAQLGAGVPPDQGGTGQGMDPTTDREFFIDRPSLENQQPENRRNAIPDKFPKAGCHPTKIPQTPSNRVGQLSQVRSGQYCEVPSRTLIPDDRGGPRRTAWTNDIGSHNPKVASSDLAAATNYGRFWRLHAYAVALLIVLQGLGGPISISAEMTAVG